MIRRVAVIVLALALSPAVVRAQDTVITVNVASADVYKGPSTVTPIIGHAPRGTVLPVARNLGSWVKVPWPDAPDGVGYVHVTMGRVGPATGAAPATSMSSPAPSARAPMTTTPSTTVTPVSERAAPRVRQNVTPVSHVFGVGGLAGSMSSFGATVRAWRTNRLGVQVGFARDAMTGTVGGRMTSLQVDPGVVYALFDRVTDYVWFRPYIGSTVGFRHETLSAATPLDLVPASHNGVGIRVFGGTELTFASLPRLGLSADLGYRRFPTPFPGFETRPLSASIAGHWYIK